jgi:chemotaxis protein methyltransferase CheR
VDQEHSGNRASGELTEEEYLLFRDYIANRTGMYFDVSKLEMLRASLVERMQVYRLEHFADYFQLLSSHDGAKEFDQLVDLITIPETYFFRDQAQLTVFKRQVLPEILWQREDFPLRIWSAGCATGEEPYTIAMILAEEIPKVLHPHIQILATDVSHTALEAARRGVYQQRSLRHMPAEYCRRFFTKQGDNTYILDESVKQMVEFRYFNLITEPYPLQEGSGWDVIFCRNVTIYFNSESTKRVIHNFYRSLHDGGYLFAGFSENLRYVSDEFTVVHLGGVFLYQKQEAEGDKEGPVDIWNSGARSHQRYSVTGKSENNVLPVSRQTEKKERLQQICSVAKELLQTGQPERASALLEPYSEETAAPSSVLLLQAEIALNRGDLEKASQACNRIIRQEPNSVAGHFMMGIIYRIWEDEGKAIAEFRKVVQLKPDHALARYYLGDIYSQRGQDDVARIEFTHAIRLLQEYPGSLDVRFAGGFSTALLVDTCRSRLQTLSRRQKIEDSSRNEATR